jgi:hypothetical protein
VKVVAVVPTDGLTEPLVREGGLFAQELLFEPAMGRVKFKQLIINIILITPIPIL